MFSGIINNIGTVKSIVRQGESAKIRIEANFSEALVLGESIAVNGACLTVTEQDKNNFCADISAQTLEKTTLGSFKKDETVNLERALKIGDRLGGHFVSGHIDGIGKIIKRNEKSDNFFELTISVEKEIREYLVAQGSVAVDGISLTIAKCLKDGFVVSVIPFTLVNTTLKNKNSGDKVNIECDMLGKYVKSFLAEKKPGITPEFLMERGFI